MLIIIFKLLFGWKGQQLYPISRLINFVADIVKK